MSTARHLEAREAELSVLGGILLDNGALDRVSEFLAPDDFFSPRHRVVFSRMLALAEDNQPIDLVTLATALEQGGELDAVGGIDHLMSLAEAKATAVNIEHHAHLVHDNAEVRRLVTVCTGVIEKAQSGDYDDTTRLFDEAQAAVYEIGAKQRKGSFTDMPTALQSVIEKVKLAFESKSAVTGLPTGFIDLDAKTAGLQGGDLIILAARPAMGKTAFALNLAANGARLGGKSVAVFSLEMPTTQLAARMLAGEARVDSERMRSGHLTDGDIDRLLQAVKRMNTWSVHIDDTAGVSVMELRSKCRRLASDRNIPDLGLVVIDYLQLMKGRPGIRSREQEISDISRNLKSLAKELDIPVVALSQLNRGVESRPNKRPLMSDLRESGAIEQDADIIMFVYRDEYYNPDTEDQGITEIIIGKQRNGPIGTVKLKFFKEWSRFDNLMLEE
ncbi:MAG: replicative DNA helicase [Myxococcales bacterium]|nr:replicative DNA helicase [Myxococcales bacterium]